jgi:hypothetical protein
MKPHIEKRRYPRAKVLLTLNWGWTPECHFTDTLTSLSAGGCFIKTTQSAFKGRVLFIRFFIPDETVLLGEVRYNLERIGLGVEFISLTEKEREALIILGEHYRSVTQ